MLFKLWMVQSTHGPLQHQLEVKEKLKQELLTLRTSAGTSMPLLTMLLTNGLVQVNLRLKLEVSSLLLWVCGF